MLMLYIHIPFCIKKCNYCDFNSYNLDLTQKKRYLEDLKKEMQMYKTKEEISSVFIGGGTPSILTPQELEELFKNIKENFEINKDAEITVECNPGTLTLDKLKTMKEIGVNRLSIGLQAVQENHLKYIGRIHTYEEFLKNYNDAISVGFKNINVDLMYNLPNQTTKDWIETLEIVGKLEPKHISAYSLILEEGTELYSMYEQSKFELNDEDTDIEMYRYTIDFLKTKGYHQYEISNYSKEGYECEHNIGYWRCDHYIGIGAGASGYLEDNRYNNVESLEEYHNMVTDGKKPIVNNEELSVKDSIEEKIFMGLRMNEGIKYEDFKKQFNIDFANVYSEQIKVLSKRKLIKESKVGIELTQKGREISNSVFVEFIN